MNYYASFIVLFADCFDCLLLFAFVLAILYNRFNCHFHIIMLDPPTTASPSSAAPVVLPQPHAVHAVSLKLPPFWPNVPVAWFAQVAAQVLTRGITSQSMQFSYVIASLQPEIAQEIRDLLISPPTETPYDDVKATLIRRTSASEQKRLHQLLIAEELGDPQPSQLLRKMRQLLGDNVLEDGIFRQLFLKCLPKNIQLILASTPPTVSLEDLSLLADKILEVASFVCCCSSSTYRPPPPTMHDHNQQIAALQGQINELTAQLQALSTQLDARDQPRFRGRSRSRSHFSRPSLSLSPSRTRLSPYCWYHERFGTATHKCNPPCTFLSDAHTPVSHTATPQQSENFTASH